jgi:hypothetical protein
VASGLKGVANEHPGDRNKAEHGERIHDCIVVPPILAMRTTIW